MEEIVEELKKVNENLILIAEAILKTTIGEDIPTFVRVAKEVLETANKEVSEIVAEEIVETVKAAKESKTESMPKGKTTQANELRNGIRVQSMVEKKSKSVDLESTGVIVKDNDGKGSWRTVVFDGNQKPVTMRCGELKALEGDAQIPIDAPSSDEDGADEEVVEDSSTEKDPAEVSPESDSGEAGNFVFSGGKHKNNTVHGVFKVGGSGATFVRWASDNHKDKATKKACSEYLATVGDE